MTEQPHVGGHIKIFLPGESPWALVIAVNGDLLKVRITNKLFREYAVETKAQWLSDTFDSAEPLPELHAFKQGDELWVSMQDVGGHKCWQPAVVQ